MVTSHYAPDLGALVCATESYNEEAVDGYVEAACSDLLYVLHNAQEGDEKGWLYVGTLSGRRGWIPVSCVGPVKPPLRKGCSTKLSKALSY